MQKENAEELKKEWIKERDSGVFILLFNKECINILFRHKITRTSPAVVVSSIGGV